MSFARCIDTAIVIPARDEAERIAHCLDALAPQCSERVQVILVVNNTGDDTAEIANAAATALHINLHVLNVAYPAQRGVGEARRLGGSEALRSLPHLNHILTTDADCRVAPDWVARNLYHLQEADAVCGKVDLHPGETAWLAGLDKSLQDIEDTYRGLVQEAFARYGSNCTDLRGSHGQTPGASLGFTRSAYVATGGFEPIPCGEDRQIIRTLRSLGRRVRHASDIRVAASCRLTGRAAGGMADTLRARLSGDNYAADDCLPRADDLIHQIRSGAVPSWPPQLAPGDCVPARDLPAHCNKLRRFLAAAVPANAAAMPPKSPTQSLTSSAQQPIYAAPSTDG
ncbi:glycosyltransferase [Sulfitobacter delicatus]|uniref:Glycosyltransferase like family 2 n=1 Tax=Sulfitobacter delicatus TaxID=218672 RepID=A0A1G7SXC9_9RHOB|nr:glycosyltransferase [Sulfitobacter delicatus]SDG27641.1 Glycosyltransferase like family 2 [Sulfitobacter delicatus]